MPSICKSVLCRHICSNMYASPDMNTLLVKKHEGISHIERLTEGTELRFLKYLAHQNIDLFGFNAILIIEGQIEE